MTESRLNALELMMLWINEVQFVWTERHLKKPTIACLVTSQNSGSSYLNRVELQNGCLALAHANIFIPSTLEGSCMDTTTGKIDKEKYDKNMELATNVYISRVNQCPCEDSAIKLYHGTNSVEHQERRKYFLQYAKGNKKQKEAFKKEKPDLYNYFETVWQVKERHSIKGLPTQYVFILVGCFDVLCCHPVCRSGQNQLPHWYSGGPLISHLSLPIPDPARPWGNASCNECTGTHAGHLLSPQISLLSPIPPMRKPPSTVIKEKFDKLKSYPPSESVCAEIAKEVLLSVDNVRMCLDHLHNVKENQKRGAAKAAETRRRKKGNTTHTVVIPPKDDEKYYCAVCHQEYQEFTESVENWIACDSCERWFHFTCIGIVEVPDDFICDEFV